MVGEHAMRILLQAVVRLQEIGRRSVYKISSKNREKKCGLYLDIFSCVKMNVFRSVFAFRLEMHVRCDNQYWSRQGKYFWTADAVCVHGYLRFEPCA